MTAVPLNTAFPKTRRRAAQRKRRPWTYQPSFVFTYDVVVIALLLAVALVSSASPEDWPAMATPWPVLAFDQVVPLWVPWAGALGGTTISLVGVTKYAATWDAGQRWWHLSRPVLGAVTGTFSVLVLVFVLQSVAPDAVSNGYSARGAAVLTGVAFLVGYREETFRELMKRAADLILSPADAKPKDEKAGNPGTGDVDSDRPTADPAIADPAITAPAPADSAITAPAPADPVGTDALSGGSSTDDAVTVDTATVDPATVDAATDGSDPSGSVSAKD